jgi:hypothetical protein
MAFRQEHRVAEIVERSGALGNRKPWRPQRGWKELTAGERSDVEA